MKSKLAMKIMTVSFLIMVSLCSVEAKRRSVSFDLKKHKDKYFISGGSTLDPSCGIHSVYFHSPSDITLLEPNPTTPKINMGLSFTFAAFEGFARGDTIPVIASSYSSIECSNDERVVYLHSLEITKSSFKVVENGDLLRKDLVVSIDPTFDGSNFNGEGSTVGRVKIQSLDGSNLYAQTNLKLMNAETFLNVRHCAVDRNGNCAFAQSFGPFQRPRRHMLVKGKARWIISTPGEGG